MSFSFKLNVKVTVPLAVNAAHYRREQISALGEYQCSMLLMPRVQGTISSKRGTAAPSFYASTSTILSIKCPQQRHPSIHSWRKKYLSLSAVDVKCFIYSDVFTNMLSTRAFFILTRKLWTSVHFNHFKKGKGIAAWDCTVLDTTQLLYLHERAKSLFLNDKVKIGPVLPHSYHYCRPQCRHCNKT